MPVLTRNLQGAALGLAAFGLYALYDTTIKFLGSAFSPVQILWCAGVFALPIVLAQVYLGSAKGGLRPLLLRWTLIRVACTLVNGILGAYAFSVLPLAEAYAVFFLMPLMISALAVPMLAEPLDLPRVVAILAGLVGVIVVLQPGQLPILPGHLAAFVSAVLGSVNYVILRKTSGVERRGVLLFWPIATQTAVLTLALPLVWLPMPPLAVGLTLMMALELVAGWLLLIAAYRLAPSIVVAPMQYSQILWAVILGALFFGEGLNAATVIGIAIIVAAGLFLMSRTGQVARAV